MRPHRFIVGAAIVATLCGGSARAQTDCSFTGVVAAAATPVVGAEVSLPVLKLVTSTDSAGRFQLTGVNCGRQSVQIRKLGYLVRHDTIDFNSAETIRAYTLEATTQLDTVRTTATEVEYWTPRLKEFEARRKRNVGGHFISETELRKVEQASMPSILRRVPGLRIVEYGGRSFVGSRSAGSISGDQPLDSRPGSPRACWASVYLDGQMIFDGRVDLYTKPPDVGQFFALNLAGVEYYSGAGRTPLQFKSMKSNCGVLLLWTRAR